ncbi:hypothetical protein ACF0H5_000196 [Mactra antiquata]
MVNSVIHFIIFIAYVWNIVHALASGYYCLKIGNGDDDEKLESDILKLMKRALCHVIDILLLNAMIFTKDNDIFDYVVNISELIVIHVYKGYCFRPSCQNILPLKRKMSARTM